ncbi:MAG: sulfhydrogenase subunit delta [Gammaproteobacteria bacterium]|nr:sulfhydrogenase subunit delta [Gammaproteobacteria bacterium]
MEKPRIAVHKFSSCDGCQLAFLDLGEDLLTLTAQIDIRHFAEAGILGEDEAVDIAFIEGSISTPADEERIRRIRERSRLLITIGACATAGGLQALRNLADAKAWTAAVYASPEYISSLDKVQPIRALVPVDFELWGCPVNSRQILAAVGSLLNGVVPIDERDKVCMECKRQLAVCVMVSEGKPCMGPVTRTGCGALCPRFGRACYACYGPAETPNTEALGARLRGLGLVGHEIAQQFLGTTNQMPVFLDAAQRWEKTP